MTHSVEYRSYLRSKEWKATREWALERAQRRCQLCNGRFGLQVHHRTYENLGHELPSDLIVLCDQCHKTHHAQMEKPPDDIGKLSVDMRRVYANPNTKGGVAAIRFQERVKEFATTPGSREHVQLLWDRIREIRELEASGTVDDPLDPPSMTFTELTEG